MATSTVKIIDLFAGPGGLGEGFSAYKNNAGDHPFKIALSIEKEASAHQTLTLRAFYRQFLESDIPDEYYDYLLGNLGKYPEDKLYEINALRLHAKKAREEARNLTLGEDNQEIFNSIRAALGKTTRNWILIGGPPCQAYSVAGRVRNKGKKDYVAEEDHRNFLYKEYLRVISKFQPAVFVMENVRGMLSAKINGDYIFSQILKDLRCPSRALRNQDDRVEYHIFPLVEPTHSDLFDSDNLAPEEYLIKSEHYGIPQTRHRVILLGIRSDMVQYWNNNFLHPSISPTTKTVTQDLPKLRSGLSKSQDSYENWKNELLRNSTELLKQIRMLNLSEAAFRVEEGLDKISSSHLGRGYNWAVPNSTNMSVKLNDNLLNWYKDPYDWNGVINHDTRSHIQGDLHRYLFSACYAKAYNGDIPKTRDFPKLLRADHANWESGHFADRFRTQVANQAAKTITSHIAKDGHYYIHYDPSQCRSLTVREAARIQTFPDNYFFVGNRTQQYVQVGNAVPPYLAKQIADIVYCVLNAH